MDTLLQTTLATIIQQLAEFFGMTTDIIMENAPMWLAKYGWFTLMQNLPLVIFAWIGLTLLSIFAEAITASEFDWKTGTLRFAVILTIIIWTIIVFGTWFMQCAVAPELYGLNALLDAIKK